MGGHPGAESADEEIYGDTSKSLYPEDDTEHGLLQIDNQLGVWDVLWEQAKREAAKTRRDENQREEEALRSFL